MSDTTFVAGTVIQADWLNDVNDYVYNNSSNVVTQLTNAMNADTLSINTTAPDSTSSAFKIYRDASYTGGTPGYVNGGIYVQTTVGAAATSFEWAIVGVVYNYANAGENVGVYGQGNKMSVSGPTWGGVFEGTDLTNANVGGSSGGLLGIEVDIWCNGTDGVDSINSSTGVQTIGSRRIGVDITAGNAQLIRNGVNGIGRGEAFAGIRVGGSTNATTGGAYYNALAIMTALSAGVYNYAQSTWGIRHTGQYVVGIDLSEAQHTTSAIRIKANDNIALEATSVVKLKYNSTSGYIEFYNGSTRRGYIDITAGSDTNFNNNGGTGVLLTGNQTVAGIKTFTSVTPFTAGITLPSASVNLGTTWTYSSNLINIGGTNAQAFINAANFDLDGICTSGFISAFIGGAYNAVLLEYILRPLYCMVSSITKDLQNKKVL